MGVYRSFWQIADTAGGQPAADADARHVTYHRWVVGVGSGLAAVGVALGLVTSVVMAADAKSGRDVKGVLLMPVLFGMGGFVFGMAVTCLFAPRAFLTGPIGRPWMKLIGTQSVALARIACLLFGLIVTGVAVGLALLSARRA